ncbi:MAG TPA: hypothetical protein VGL19_16990, partial [Polyangiaceae bacterium]
MLSIPSFASTALAQAPAPAAPAPAPAPAPAAAAPAAAAPAPAAPAAASGSLSFGASGASADANVDAGGDGFWERYRPLPMALEFGVYGGVAHFANQHNLQDLDLVPSTQLGHQRLRTALDLGLRAAFY